LVSNCARRRKDVAYDLPVMPQFTKSLRQSGHLGSQAIDPQGLLIMAGREVGIDLVDAGREVGIELVDALIRFIDAAALIDQMLVNPLKTATKVCQSLLNRSQAHL